MYKPGLWLDGGQLLLAKNKMKNIKITFLLVSLLLCGNITSAFNKKAASVKEFKTNFELIKNLIIIKVQLDGKDEDFILDSGAPSIILNAVFYSDTSKIATAKQGIVGSYKTGMYKINKLVWNNTVIKDTEVLSMDMSNLTAQTGRPIKGLIGYDMLKNSELLIDYKRKELIISTGEKLQLHQVEIARDSVSFVYRDHIPVLTLNINGSSHLFGLDCGAGRNLISQQLFKEIPKSMYKLTGTQKLGGADQNFRQVSSFKLKEFYIGTIKYKRGRFLTSDISHLNRDSNLIIDGLLGFPYLSRFKTSIDFANKKIYIWS